MITHRFTGTVERLGAVNIYAAVTWVTTIPFTAWPQQTPLAAVPLRPAMVNDRHWYGFGAVTDPLVARVLATMTQGASDLGRLLSVVMPGDAIPPHVDKQPKGWWGRIHVPLLTDPASRFVVGGEAHHLVPGWAYVVNTGAEHWVENLGAAPRVHFMLDVGAHE